jgi:hypothetical protein
METEASGGGGRVVGQGDGSRAVVRFDRGGRRVGAGRGEAAGNAEAREPQLHHDFAS